MTPEISRKHYVYTHRRASDGLVFYVGKGTARRAWSASGRNRKWRHIAEKHGFEVEIVRSALPEPCALSLEIITISGIGLARLANIVAGGGGTTGWKHSEETKRRIGDFHKGRAFTQKMREALARYNEGKVYSPETLARMSQARRGKKFGPHSAETKAKISAAHIGLRPSEEARRKMSLAKIGKACGRQSPTYDHTIRTFEHPELGQFTGTRADFVVKHGLAHGCVSAVINGRQKSVKGWRQL